MSWRGHVNERITVPTRRAVWVLDAAVGLALGVLIGALLWVVR